MWKILCASVEEDIRSEIEKLGQGTSFYKVKCVASIDEMFLAFITEPFDAYILDTSLRQESTIELVRAIRAADPKGKIVCLSTNESNRFKAIDAGADAFLVIPDEFHLLRLKIEDLFDEAD